MVRGWKGFEKVSESGLGVDFGLNGIVHMMFGANTGKKEESC